MAVINGTSGDDNFTNSPSSDTYFGQGGNDTLQSGFDSGSDAFQGGDGNDLLQLSAPLFYVTYIQDTRAELFPMDFEFFRRVALSDGTFVTNISSAFDIGWEQFQAADTSVLVTFFSGSGVNVTGTAANELFGGASTGQTISGGDGTDVIYANGGADTVFGGNGVDYISAGLDDGANDTFNGGADVDTISYSGSGPVTIDLNGSAAGASIGSDTLLGFEVAVGSQSNDTLIGTNDANTLHGLFGNDYFYAGNGNDLVFGGAGVDVLLGEGGNDVLNGGDDTDYLYSGPGGGSTLYGDNGVDVLYCLNPRDSLFGGEGSDYFYFIQNPSQSTPVANGGNGNDICTDLSGLTNETFNGDAGQDYHYAFGGNDTFFGGAGVDVFLGGNGNDVFDGGTDVDYAWGENGSDTYITRPTNGVLVLNDFTAGGTEDSVRLLDTGFASLAQVLDAMTFEAGLNTTILTIDADTSIWFIAIHPSQFVGADFAFA